MPDLARVLAGVAAAALVVGAGAFAVQDGIVPWAPTARPTPVPSSSVARDPAPTSTPPTSPGPTRSTNPTPFSTTPPTPLTVVALGDSVPSASTCDCAGYVEQLGTWLQHTTHRKTLVHNDAVDGWTTADVENTLRDKATRADLSHADLVVIEIGANDFDFGNVDDPACFQDPDAPCWRPVLRDMRSRLTRIIPEIRALDSEPNVRVAVAGYWNVTVDGQVGRANGPNFVTGSDVLTRLVNSTIQSTARSTDALYVDFYAPLKGQDGSRDPTDDLLDDGDHPNQSGHTLLTRALIDALQSTGVVTAWTVG